MEAVQQNGMALEYASADQRETYEILLAAVQQNGMALEFACVQLESIVLSAVRQNGLALQFAEDFCSNIEIVHSVVLSCMLHASLGISGAKKGDGSDKLSHGGSCRLQKHQAF